MKKILSLFLLAGIIFLGLAIYAYLNAQSLIAYVKPKIQSSVSSSLGSEVTLGEISLGFWPTFSLDIHDVNLTGKAGENASIKNVSLALDFFALLQKKLSIKNLSIESPSVTIVQDKAGLHIPGKNADNAPIRAHTETTGSSSQNHSSSTQATELPLVLSLEKASIKNGLLNFKDLAANQDIVLSDISLETAISSSGNVFDINNFKTSASINKTIPIAASFKTASFDLGSQTFTFPALTTSLNKNELIFRGEFNAKAIKGDIGISSPEGVALKNYSEVLKEILKVDLSTLKLEGKAVPDLSLHISSPKDFNSKGSIILKDVSCQLATFNLHRVNASVDIEGNAQAHTFSSKNIQFLLNDEAGALSFTASASPSMLSGLQKTG